MLFITCDNFWFLNKCHKHSFEGIVLVKPPTSFLSEPSYDAEFQHFLCGRQIVLNGSSMSKIDCLTAEQIEGMERLSRLPIFFDLTSKVQEDVVSCINAGYVLSNLIRLHLFIKSFSWIGER